MKNLFHQSQPACSSFLLFSGALEKFADAHLGDGRFLYLTFFSPRGSRAREYKTAQCVCVCRTIVFEKYSHGRAEEKEIYWYVYIVFRVKTRFLSLKQKNNIVNRAFAFYSQDFARYFFFAKPCNLNCFDLRKNNGFVKSGVESLLFEKQEMFSDFMFSCQLYQDFSHN